MLLIYGVMNGGTLNDGSIDAFKKLKKTFFYLIFFYLPLIAPCFSCVYCFSNVYCSIALLLYSLFLVKHFVTSDLERCDINKLFFKRKERSIFRRPFLLFFFPGLWSGQNNNSVDFKSITLFISSAASRCVWSRHTHLNNTDTDNNRNN